MKAVILAAGRSTRTYPLTETRPKTLLKVANKTILQHNLEQLDGLVDEAIIIVGYRADMIRQEFKDRFGTIALAYVEQKEQLGTGHALQQARGLIEGDFLVMNGDDLYFRDDIKKVIGRGVSALMVRKVKNPERFAAVVAEKGKVKRLVEKPAEFVSDLASTGLYLFPKKVFDISIGKSPRGEFEIVDYVISLAKSDGVLAVEAEHWFPVSYPWDLLAANEYLLAGIKKDVQGEMEANVILKNEVAVGKGTVLKSGTYIEGPCKIGGNCTIGPNAYIRPSTSIGNSCKVGHEVEIKNSIIMDRSTVPHLSYIGDSVIGENVNIGAGSITANFRHDAGLIRSSVVKDAGEIRDDGSGGGRSEELADTGRKKFGTIIGDNAKLGVKTIIYPGRKIFSGKSTLPGEIVKQDIT